LLKLIQTISPTFATPPNLPSTTGPFYRASKTQLKPTAILSRLRPAKLEAMTRLLQEYSRTASALHLLNQFFPESFRRYPPLSHPIWPEVLIHILRTAEAADWFEVNWVDFNARLHMWESDQTENGDLLAYFLHHIPVKQYGFTPHGFSTPTIGDYPLMELMYVLLSDNKNLTHISSDILIELEVYDGFDNIWTEAERQAAWGRLCEVEKRPYRFPKRVRMLPPLARWAIGQTGNPLLDYPSGKWLNELVAQRLGYHYRFSWAEVDPVRRYWQQAKPVLRQFDQLVAWSQQNRNPLIVLFNFFAEGDYEELEG
jgi:hypothetical protein